MEVDFISRLAVNLAFRNCDASEDGDRFLLHPVREPAAADHFLDAGKRAAVLVTMLVLVFMLMSIVGMRMPVFMTVRVRMVLVMIVMSAIVLQMNIELRAGDL